MRDNAALSALERTVSKNPAVFRRISGRHLQNLFSVTALRAAAFLQIFVASCCRGRGGEGRGGRGEGEGGGREEGGRGGGGRGGGRGEGRGEGGGGRGGGEPLCLRCSPMVEPSVYDELQGTIDLVTSSKKRRASSADSTASVAGSVWGAEPATLYWLCSTALKTELMFWFWVVVW